MTLEIPRFPDIRISQRSSGRRCYITRLDDILYHLDVSYHFVMFEDYWELLSAPYIDGELTHTYTLLERVGVGSSERAHKIFSIYFMEEVL